MKPKRCNGTTRQGKRCKRRTYRRNCGGHRRRNPLPSWQKKSLKRVAGEVSRGIRPASWQYLTATKKLIKRLERKKKLTAREKIQLKEAKAIVKGKSTRQNPTFRETINKKTRARRYYVNGRRVSRDAFERAKSGLRLSCFSTRSRGKLIKHECFGNKRRKR